MVAPHQHHRRHRVRVQIVIHVRGRADQTQHDPLRNGPRRRLTRRAGHEACAFDQYEAREILATKVLTPDVIVVDPDGTEGSSLEGIDRILSGAGDAPVIVLAAYLPPETEAAIHESGAALILRKPAGAKDLQRALLAALVGGS